MHIQALNSNVHRTNFGKVSNGAKKQLLERVEGSAISQAKKEEAKEVIDSFIKSADELKGINIMSCDYGSGTPSGIVAVKAGDWMPIDNKTKDSRMLDFCYGEKGQLCVEVYGASDYQRRLGIITGIKKGIMDAREYFDILLRMFESISQAEQLKNDARIEELDDSSLRFSINNNDKLIRELNDPGSGFSIKDSGKLIRKLNDPSLKA